MNCPSCGAQLDRGRLDWQSPVCPYCGAALPDIGDGRRAAARANTRYGLGWEYTSRLTLFGLPLIHIASGVDPDTGRPLVARGIIAVGNVAIGVVALGGVALGGLTLGGASFGLLAIGGLAIGGCALGGLAIGAYLALGGLAISLTYAVGGAAFAPCALSGAGGDPACFEPLLEKLRELGLHIG